MEKIKILTIVEKGSGSRYHRLRLPLERMIGRKIEDREIEVSFLDTRKLNESDIKDINVLWVNRLSPIDANTLDMWKNKYGFKYIVDLDDFIAVEGKVFNAEKFKLQEPLIARQLILADLVIVSSLELINEVGHFNTNISFIPNGIPFEEGQFKLEGRVEDKKVRFGIVGSISHYYDYLSLRNVMKKILSDKEFQEKAKIVIVANENVKYWKNIINVFKHKNVELQILDLRDVENYMDVYNHIDVLLAPLEDNRFNRVRTNLKMFEAACKEIPVIGSQLFLDKGGNFFIPVTKSEDWYKAIKAFIKNKDYRDLGRQIRKFLMEKFPYENFVEKRMNCLEETLKKQETSKLEDVKVYTITYDDDQYSPFERYSNNHIRTLEQKSFRFEWNPIIDVVSNKIDNYEGFLGIFSWKFSDKTGLFPDLLDRMLRGHNYNSYDFINLAPKYWKNGEEYLQFSEEEHVGLLERLEEVCNVVGLDYTNKPKTVNFSNFYLMKTEHYKDYINNYITPALEYMEARPERFMIDANYKSGLDAEKLEEVSGLEFYPISIFLLERMILMYIETKQLKTLNLI